MTDPTARFGACADAYARGRPGYPAALRDLLIAAGLGPGARVLELGAGTGLSTALLLTTGAQVFAVEPNPAMRAHLAARFAAAPALTVVAGTAEATTLPDRAADHAVVMQAFHWFDVEATRRELARVLAPGATVALIWNTRHAATPFMRDLEAMFRRFAPAYDRLGHVGANRDAKLVAFFRHGHRHVALAHDHAIDRAGLDDYLASVSYLPAAGHPDHPALVAAAAALVAAHAAPLALTYVTDVYLAPLPA